MPGAPVRRGLQVPTGAAWLRRRAAAGVAVALLGAMALAPPAAQEAGTYSIRAAPIVAASAASGVRLPIEAGPAGAIPKGSFVTVRGLPPSVALKDGHAVGPGSWAVPLSALPSLVAEVPDGVSGRSEIVISLIAADGRLLAQNRSALVIQPGSPAATPSPAATAPPPPVSAPAAAELTEEQRARAERMLARGEAYLANGNIMGARDFFERAADAGLAAAALRLAATYDPAVLKRLKVQGVAPDASLARKWYERARDLGSAEAGESLARLGE